MSLLTIRDEMNSDKQKTIIKILNSLDQINKNLRGLEFDDNEFNEVAIRLNVVVQELYLRRKMGPKNSKDFREALQTLRHIRAEAALKSYK